MDGAFKKMGTGQEKERFREQIVLSDRKRRVCEGNKRRKMIKSIKKGELNKDNGFIQRKSSYLILLSVKLYKQKESLLKSKKSLSSGG